MRVHSVVRAVAVVGCVAVSSLAGLAGEAATASAAPVNPTVLLPNIVIGEGDRGLLLVTVNVALSRPNPFDHTVDLEVVDYSAVPVPGGGGATYGTATPGTDYVAFPSFHLHFAPGAQVARFVVKVKGDSIVEGNEEIDVRFDDTTFAVQDNDIDLVIADDDSGAKPEQPLLLLPNQVVPEPDAGCYDYRVTVGLSTPAPQVSTVEADDFTATPVPGGGGATYGTATPGVDYRAFGSRTLSFAAGAKAAVLPVRVCGDTAVEGDEEIDVRFGNTSTIAVQDNDIDLVLADND